MRSLPARNSQRYVAPVRPHGWIALLLAAACLAVFLPVRNHEFVGFDDYMYVVQNPNLRDGLSLTGLQNAFRPYFSNWIPLTALSLQLDYAALPWLIPTSLVLAIGIGLVAGCYPLIVASTGRRGRSVARIQR